MDVKTKEGLRCAITDGDTVLSGGNSGVVKLWEMGNEEKKPKLVAKKVGGGGGIVALDLSRDGQWCVAGVDLEDSDDLFVYKTR
jgi:hypothetical protein